MLMAPLAIFMIPFLEKIATTHKELPGLQFMQQSEQMGLNRIIKQTVYKKVLRSGGGGRRCVKVCEAGFDARYSLNSLRILETTFYALK